MAVAADKGVVVVDDMGGDMQCSNHPYKNNNNPGGICAFCLQEKLGRLVSSSKSDPSFFPVNAPPPTTAAAAGDSSSSPSSLITARSSNSGFGTSNSINIKNAAAAAALALGTASSSAHDNHNNKTATITSSSSNMMIMTAGTNSNIHHDLLQKKTSKSTIAATNSYSSLSEQHQNNKLVMLKRSKSTAASNTRRINSHEPRHQIFDNDDEEEELGTNEYSPAVAKSATRNKHHRGFWSSFLHLTSVSNRTSKRTIRSSPYGERDHRDRMAVLSNTTATNTNSITISSTIAEKEKQLGGGNESTSNNGVAAAASSTGTRDTIGGYGDGNDSPNSSSHASSSNSFGRKVARSRSVGCGSRSFSGAFLEKISTGFGDCSTLRRVESQRESSTTNSNYHLTNNKMVAVDDHHRRNHHRHIKERVKCGGIFGGFTMANTSNNISNGGRVVAAVVGPPHGRSRNWGWAFASPMRAFRPPTYSLSSSSSKPDGSVVVAAAPKDIWFV